MLEQSQIRSSDWPLVPWGPRQVALAFLSLLALWGLGVALTLGLSLDLAALVLLAEGSLLLLAWWYGPKTVRASTSLLGFRRSQRTVVGWALAALFASIFLTALYSFLVPEDLLPPSLPEDLISGRALVPAVIGIVLLAPVAEEAFFRGFVYPGLARRWGLGAGAIASSVLFAVSHVSLGLLVPAFMSGMVLLWVYRRTGSLWPGILAHAAQNGIAVAVAA
jgi:membrane protease YdiL (CAAX protease family)